MTTEIEVVMMSEFEHGLIVGAIIVCVFDIIRDLLRGYIK